MKIIYPPDQSSESIHRIVAEAKGDVVFVGDPRTPVEPGSRMFERMAQVVTESGAGWVYSDSLNHPRIDYQLGSIRDGFDFGPVVAVSTAAAREAGTHNGHRFGGLYDLRLRISEKRPIVRVPETLYRDRAATELDHDARFAYVDPQNRDYQIEMEAIATDHLKRIGAFLEPKFRPFEPAKNRAGFPVEASVVIPVRNRERTIEDAVRSALSQETDFPFNVIVVENHSTDQTGQILRRLADSRLVVHVPARPDLGIGGCWNEAIFHERCGRYVAQLDSDDLYSSPGTLQQIVDALRAGPYALVVGAYTLVNFQLQEIPPGLIDHREWTRDNGRNNALRVNGFGAPRAYATSVVRAIGFPNVSYGEDYAMALRVSREYDVGRIYDSIYVCRRWDGNSDSSLPLETANRHDLYKDWVRTNEIRARQQR
ncbi:MAG TPA: glycosyltransferase family A protein [Terriglobia bacterium]|nr:glycosyltransferase family A protein [Terriglobia bacterium]